ncbi:hypothetical protein ABIC28_001633 [Rhodococcus sp. PvR044]|uniref:SHOCT domain-containing protein n=1 Tax=Rhodococcus sp. PvR044 TaxID=3156402 RepID=UPI003393BD16
MAKKFNPAPGWPAAPEGWLPFAGWEPDAAWPPAPAGWQIVIDDGTPEPTAGSSVAGMLKRAAQGIAAHASAESDALAQGPDVVWSAKGQPLTGVGGGRYRMTASTLFFETGTLTTNAQQVPTNQLFDIDMRQTLTQKARGIGDVVVHIHRQSGVEQAILRDVPNPREAVAIINRVAYDARMAAHTLANTHHYTSGLAPHVATPPPAHASQHAPIVPEVTAKQLDPMEQLVKLGELRDAGVLTEDEFAAKKAEILARM